MSDGIETSKFSLDERRLRFEQEKLGAEGKRAWWTLGSTLGAVLISAGTLIFAVLNGQQQAAEAASRLQREAEARTRELETQTLIAMINSAYSQELAPDIGARLRSMAELLGDRLSTDARRRIEGFRVSENVPFDQRERYLLLRLVAADPSRLPALLRVWQAVFPGDQAFVSEILVRLRDVSPEQSGAPPVPAPP